MDNAEIVEEKVRGLLAGAQTLFLSTCGDAVPWGAGAFFAESDPFTLSLVLEAQGRTLANMRANPNVAIVVSSGDPFAPFLQGQAQAVVLGDDDKARTCDAIVAKAPQSAPFMDAPIVPVTLQVSKWRVTDVVNGWLPGKELAAPAGITLDLRGDAVTTQEASPASV
ncbi:MAG: pyridoxamine 5'-phosphate oxidase family protein [Actinomycetota bacterium]|nr:pyridoxamine 5'-phosphate oxidase family protein [Actinomycetota bacterium]